MSIHGNVFDLIDEITEPTGPILTWKARLHIKQYLNHPEMSIPEIGESIAEKLRQCSACDFSAAIKCFNLVEKEEWLNMLLNALYDQCDKERILVQ